MAVLKVRQNGKWVVVGTGEKGEKGDSANIPEIVEVNVNINISSYTEVDDATTLGNPYINKLLYPYYYNNIDRMNINDVFVSTMQSLEFGKEYEVELDGIFHNTTVIGKLIRVPEGNNTAVSSTLYKWYLVTPTIAFIIYNGYENGSVHFYGKPYCQDKTATIPLVTIKSIKLITQ